MNTKNEQIIKFVVERLSGKLGRTHLIKLIYLTDYHSRRLFGQPVSTLNYYWDDHGPFDKEYYACIRKLDKSYISEETVYFPSHKKGYVFHDMLKRMKYDNLCEQEFYILEYVIRNYSQVRLQILLEDVVYKTEPMEALTKKKAFGETLPMGMIDNIDKILYEGLDPKEIINGEKAVQEGRTRSLEEAFNALQS
ncbi:MAG: DUF4065 domain-containing protein [Planctomycetes bacterium]|nr:DUF4065 domain-containing protein [Planctomycetota bacterium]